jgi:hypothetical protein
MLSDQRTWKSALIKFSNHPLDLYRIFEDKKTGICKQNGIVSFYSFCVHAVFTMDPSVNPHLLTEICE